MSNDNKFKIETVQPSDETLNRSAAEVFAQQMSNQPNEPQDGVHCSICDESLFVSHDGFYHRTRRNPDVKDHLPKVRAHIIARDLITALAANHELGKSLMAMSEKYQAMAGERDGLASEVERLKAEYNAEIDEFSAGYKAAEAGLDLETAERDYYETLPEGVRRFDVFGCGYAWASFEKLKARLQQEERETLRLIGERDRFESEITDIYEALGGDGEWTAKVPPVPPPDSGDLSADALELARRLTTRLEAAEKERDEAMALLNPVAGDETLAGAIRNLQQAHISERDNAQAAESALTDMISELAAVKQHDQRLQILCAELCAELGDVSMERLRDVSVRALNVQERIEGLEAERDGLASELRSIADMLAACGYEADTPSKAVEALIDDDRSTIQRHNATWSLLQRNLVHPDTGQPPVSLSIMELAQRMIDERDLLHQQRDAVGEAVKSTCVHAIESIKRFNKTGEPVIFQEEALNALLQLDVAAICGSREKDE